MSIIDPPTCTCLQSGLYGCRMHQGSTITTTTVPVQLVDYRARALALADEWEHKGDELCPRDDWPENGSVSDAYSADAYRSFAALLRKAMES